MIVISYDISDDLIRSRFARMLKANGAIRLQFSVYEVVNTKRIVDNILMKIERYAKHFSAADSIMIFDVQADKIMKYGNAIHRDKDILYL